ncbi:MAG: FtsX-like permease family protein [Patescibacteria group bacterium]
MTILDLFKTANSNIWKNKTRTVLTLLAIVIGVTTIIINFSIGNGANKYIVNLSNSLGQSNQLLVTASERSAAQSSGFGDPTEYAGSADALGRKLLDDTDLEKIKKIEEITKINTNPVNSIDTEYIQYENGKKFIGTLVDYNQEDKEIYQLVSGSLDNLDKNDIILPTSYIRVLDIGSNEEVINQNVELSFKTLNQEKLTRSYTIKAVFEPTIITSQSIVLTRSEVEDLEKLNNPNSILAGSYTSFTVYFNDDISDSELEKLRNKISDLGLFSITLEDISQEVLGLVYTLQFGLGAFSVLIIIASLFGVTNTLLMSVIERTKELGLMKALGMTNWQVLSMITLESSLLGFWGSLAGVIVGWVIGLVVNPILLNGPLQSIKDYTPLSFSFLGSALTILGISVCCYIIALLPARRAVKIQPTQALKEE